MVILRYDNRIVIHKRVGQCNIFISRKLYTACSHIEIDFPLYKHIFPVFRPLQRAKFHGNPASLRCCLQNTNVDSIAFSTVIHIRKRLGILIETDPDRLGAVDKLQFLSRKVLPPVSIVLVHEILLQCGRIHVQILDPHIQFIQKLIVALPGNIIIRRVGKLTHQTLLLPDLRQSMYRDIDFSVLKCRLHLPCRIIFPDMRITDSVTIQIIQKFTLTDIARNDAKIHIPHTVKIFKSKVTVRLHEQTAICITAGDGRIIIDLCPSCRILCGPYQIHLFVQQLL